MTIQTEPARRRILAHSSWDLIPVLAGLAHLVYFVALFLVFNYLPWWGVVLGGLGYAYLIGWNINSVSHNFIHNSYFVSPILNRAFRLLLSLCMVFSQTMYHWVHTRHHIGNTDRPGPDFTAILQRVSEKQGCA